MNHTTKSTSILAIIAITLSGIVLVKPWNRASTDYTIFCMTYGDYNCRINAKWNLIIYLDVEACLACTEEMSYWIELERLLPQYNCSFSIWAPKSDSLDVAIAMELEGLTSPVRVLPQKYLTELQWLGKPTPIKVLLNNDCSPVIILPPSNSVMQSKANMVKIYNKVLLANEL